MALRHRRRHNNHRNQRNTHYVLFDHETLVGYQANPMRCIFRIPSPDGSPMRMNEVRHNLWTWAEIHDVPGYTVGYVIGIEIEEGGRAVLITLQVEGEE